MRAPSQQTPLSLPHLSEIDTPPLALIEAAHQAGFASLCLRTAPAAPGGQVYPLTAPDEQAAVNRLIAETGVSVLYVELITLTERTDAADYRPMLAAGAAIGAHRLVVSGESADLGVMAARFAEICDLAAEFGFSVELEFMPYRGVASLADAAEVIDRAARPNGAILLDALHFHRSASSLDELARMDPSLIGSFQLCDAPAAPPADLVAEARFHRLLPGQGELALWSLIDALPEGLPIGVEVPLYTVRPDLSVAERLAILVNSARDFFAQRDAT